MFRRNVERKSTHLSRVAPPPKTGINGVCHFHLAASLKNYVAKTSPSNKLARSLIAKDLESKSMLLPVLQICFQVLFGLLRSPDATDRRHRRSIAVQADKKREMVKLQGLCDEGGCSEIVRTHISSITLRARRRDSRATSDCTKISYNSFAIHTSLKYSLPILKEPRRRPSISKPRFSYRRRAR